LDVTVRERKEVKRTHIKHRTELSAHETRSRKGRSCISKSCNVARPNELVLNLRNGLNHPQTEFQNFARWKAASSSMHASETNFPICFASRFKNSIPEHGANNFLPASLALSENEKPRKQKIRGGATENLKGEVSRPRPVLRRSRMCLPRLPTQTKIP
jgi:hypothetical protein